MKKIFTIIICLSCLMVSCVEDTGNYNYLSVEDVTPVKIDGIDTRLEVIINNKLDVNPIVTGIDDENDYSYLWYIMNNPSPQEQLSGTIMWSDTIGREKNLSHVINYPKAEYKLYYEVRNIKTDVRAFAVTRLGVELTDRTYGYYILKDEGGYTDFDYIAFDNARSYRDILRNVDQEDKRIPGNAMKMIEQRGKYSHRLMNEQGYVTLNKFLDAFHILTDQQLITLNANNISEEYKNFNSMFYTPPAEGFAVENIVFHKGDTDALFMINGGKLYSINTENPNYGMFGPPLPIISSYILESELPYYLHPDIINLQDFAMVYDTQRKSFFTVESMLNMMFETEEAFGVEKPAGTDLQLVRMLGGTPLTQLTMFEITGKALFKDNNSQDYYFSETYIGRYDGVIPPILSYEKLPSTSGLKNATVMAAPHDGYFIYYADANKLMAAYNPTVSTTDETIYTFSSNETISYIKVEAMGSDRWSSPEYALTVLTNSASGWKLYVFEMAGNGTPTLGAIKEQYSGTGNAKHLMVRYADE